MATYRLTSPEGETFEVNAPDGATESAVMSYARAMWKRAKPAAPVEPKADPTEGTGFGQQALEGAGKAFVDIGRGAGQMLGLVDQASVDEAKRLDAPLMDTAGGMTGNIGANMLTALIPGGSTVKGAAAIGAGLSALQPVSGVNGVGELVEQKAKDIATGGVLGAGGAVAGKLVGRAKEAATNRMATLTEKVKAKAVADAASETASARSLAGRSAQDTYKQMEWLRELNATDSLTPEQSKVFKELSEELAQKAQDKFLPSAAVKKETAQLYREAIETESERAAKLAADRLSGTEAKSQMMARLKRYGPAVLGGALGSIALPGVGTLGGIAGGLYLRPAMRSMANLSKNPAVQYKMLGPIANSGLLGDLADPRILGLLGPSIYAAQE